MDKKYYKARNNSYYTKYTKDEIKSLIDIYNPDTFIPFLMVLDYPYIEEEWRRVAAYHPNETVFGRYIAKMRLFSFKRFNFYDSDNLNIAYNMMRGGSKS